MTEVLERAFSQPPELGETQAIVVLHSGEIVAEQYGPGRSCWYATAGSGSRPSTSSPR